MKYGRVDDSGLRIVSGSILTIRQRRTGAVLARVTVKELRDIVDPTRRNGVPNLLKYLFSVSDDGEISVG